MSAANLLSFSAPRRLLAVVRHSPRLRLGVALALAPVPLLATAAVCTLFPYHSAPVDRIVTKYREGHAVEFRYQTTTSRRWQVENGPWKWCVQPEISEFDTPTLAFNSAEWRFGPLSVEEQRLTRVTPYLTPATIRLRRAIAASNLAAARQALVEGADPNSRYLEDSLEYGTDCPILFTAALQGTPETALLLAAGADPNMAARHSVYGTCTALLCAIYAHKPEVVSLLLSHGARMPGGEGSNAVQNAASQGRDDILVLLLRAGAPYDQAIEGYEEYNHGDYTPYGGYTPLMVALDRGFTSTARLLIRAGANMNHHTHKGKTPLSLAERLGDSQDTRDLIRLMKQHGAHR